MNAQLSSDLLLAFIGLVVLIGVVSTACSLWFLGRGAYRKH